jgi:hypothetical protein
VDALAVLRLNFLEGISKRVVQKFRFVRNARAKYGLMLKSVLQTNGILPAIAHTAIGLLLLGLAFGQAKLTFKGQVALQVTAARPSTV